MLVRVLGVDAMGSQELVVHCEKVEAVVKRLSETEGELFGAKRDKSGRVSLSFDSLTAKSLKRVLDSGCHRECFSLATVNMNPYVNTFHEVLKTHGTCFLKEAMSEESKVAHLNKVVDDIRLSVNTDLMRNINRRQEKAKKKRVESVSGYIEAMRSSYARVNCLRVDLGYRKGMFADSENLLEDLALVKSHWKKMREDLARGEPVEGLIGFVVSLEYGLLSGYHFHAIFIYNGAYRQQDVSLAKILGDHWVQNVVPNGAGRYYNCNRFKDKYRRLGVGVINHYENEKFEVLKSVVLGYMAKTDYVIDSISPSERAWFRGITPKRNSQGKGRPRGK